MADEKKGQEPSSFVKTPEFLALNPKQRKFVLQYIKTGNASRSYFLVYKCEIASAEAASSALLRNLKVQDALQLGMRLTNEAVEKSVILSKQERMEILSKIAKANLKNVVQFSAGGFEMQDQDEIDEDDLIAVKSISSSSSSSSEGSSSSVSIAVHDRVKAIEVLSRMTGDISADDAANKPRDTGSLQGRIAGLLERKRKLGIG